MNRKMMVILVCVAGFLTACQGIGMVGGGAQSPGAMMKACTEEANAQTKIYGAQETTQANPTGLKYLGRYYYTMTYPDAKPVAYNGSSITAYYDLTKQNQNKIIEDENFVYFFKYSKDGTILNSCQFDKKTFDNTKNLIKAKTGLMEPVFMLKQGSLDIAVDDAATRQVHKRLSKTLKLKPVADSLKYGALMRDYINAETVRRGEIVIERVAVELEKQTSSTKLATGYFLKTLIRKIKGDKSGDVSGNEFQTIYNVKFKEILANPVFSGADYLLIINKDNYVIDRLPNFATTKIENEYYYKKMFDKRKNEIDRNTQMNLVMGYYRYKSMILGQLASLERGFNYSNVSLNLVSIERLKNLTDTGHVFTPDVKITTTNIPLLDAMLENNMTAVMNKTVSDAEAQCRGGFGEFYSQECWDTIVNEYDKLWGLDYGMVNAKAKAVVKKYDLAVNTLEAVKAELKLTSGLKGKKLK